MTNTKSAKKSLKQSKIQRINNISQRSMLKTFIKKLYQTINKKNENNAISQFTLVQKILDRQVQKRLIHKNKAARFKSKIHMKIKSMRL